MTLKEFNISDTGSCHLINNLFNNDNIPIYYREYCKRHPGEMILDKIKFINNSLDKLLEISNNYSPFEIGHQDIIFTYIKNIQSFIEILLLTFKLITPKPEEDRRSHRNTSDWLKQYNLTIYNNFKDATDEHNQFINACANYAKHDDAFVRYIEATNYNNKIIKGFYFTSVLDEEGYLVPAPIIHEKYLGTIFTAFSFNHFMLRTGGIIALNLYWANKIIYSKLNSTQYSVTELKSFFQKLSKIENIFFPDEYNSKYAKINFNSHNIHIKFEKYHNYNDKHDFNTMKTRPCIIPNYKGNAKIRMPYWS